MLYRHDGRKLGVGTIRYYMANAQKRVGLRVVDGRALGELHILGHTLWSRLAMRGATAKSIQELAGQQHLSTTKRYMHLSPAARESAIRLLDAPAEKLGDGRIGSTPAVKVSRVGGGSAWESNPPNMPLSTCHRF